MTASALAHLPPSGPTELLFLLFHGVGEDASKMTPLAQRLAAEYPQAAVICLNAPDPFEGEGGQGWQWFSPAGLTEASRVERVAAALPRFIAVVRAVQQQFHMGWERTALAGFSQGAVMSLEAVQAEPQLAGRVLAFAGRHATPPAHAPVDTTVHLFHGMTDRVIPPGPAIDSAERLVALGGDVTADVLPHIGHELHPALMDKAIEQLRTFLPKKVWREAMSDAPVISGSASSRDLGH
ncbi:esterase [Piscinibacter sp. HJYY11]|uniref:esterase n=1 Tax=Piscinibacter sp. HJYY11 TaxID=2801333 RepID=UPI00191E50AC|nr:esterase [Piscinibacter sp. HJYY11]MBL0728757.1 esterase [Piscinibacter sp. HJYY11]